MIMDNKPVAPKTGGRITKKTAAELAAYRKAIGRQGGRPKGVLNTKTIAKINSRETFIEHVGKHAGRLADDLLRSSEAGDTRATLGALDRVGIIAVQKVEHEHKFSLIGLDGVRKSLNAAPEMIDATKDMRIIDTHIDVSDDE